MKLECPYSHRTTSQIYCKKRNAICVYQRYRPCKKMYEFLPGAEKCRARQEVQNEN